MFFGDINVYCLLFPSWKICLILVSGEKLLPVTFLIKEAATGVIFGKPNTTLLAHFFLITCMLQQCSIAPILILKTRWKNEIKCCISGPDLVKQVLYCFFSYLSAWKNEAANWLWKALFTSVCIIWGMMCNICTTNCI